MFNNMTVLLINELSRLVGVVHLKLGMQCRHISSQLLYMCSAKITSSNTTVYALVFK
jgi:hypothetical protein